MIILEQKFNVEPVPQGNRTVRFRWALEQGEQISKVVVPFVYVTKDHWRAAMGHATTAQLLIAPFPVSATQTLDSLVSAYTLTGGKHTLIFTHFDVVDVPRREMNSIHPIPLVYIQATWWLKHGHEPNAFIRLVPQ